MERKLEYLRRETRGGKGELRKEEKVESQIQNSVRRWTRRARYSVSLHQNRKQEEKKKIKTTPTKNNTRKTFIFVAFLFEDKAK